MRRWPDEVSETRIIHRLFSTRHSRRMQVSLLWLVIGTGVAPPVIWLGYLSWPAMATDAAKLLPSNRTIVQPRRVGRLGRSASNGVKQSSETPLWMDSPLRIAFLCLVCGIGAFFFMLLCRWNGIAVIAPVSACAVFALLACLLFLVNGWGNTSVIGAKGEDLFVVYGLPLSVAVGLGATAGAMVAETR